MAQYNSFSDVADNPQFAQFIKERFGIDDVSKVAEIDRNSLLAVFKSFEGDLSEDELFSAFHEMGQAQYETGQVSNDEMARFLMAKEEYISQHPDAKEHINSKIDGYLKNEAQEEMVGSAPYTVDEDFRNRYQKLQNDYLAALNQQEERTTPDPTLVVGGHEDTPPENQQQEEFEIEWERLRSAESDRKAYSQDFISYDILLRMNKIEKLEPEKIAHADELYKAVFEATRKLDDEENQQFNDEFIKIIADNQQVLDGVPPSVLAKSYEDLTVEIVEKQNEISKTDDNDEKKQQLTDELQTLQDRKARIAGRIDELTDMLVADTHTDKDLFFADDTNVADVYDGYAKMFEARAKDLQTQQSEENPNPEITQKLQKMQDGQGALDIQYNSYLEHYDLQNVSKDSAKDLNDRYEKMAKELDKVVLNDEAANLVIMQNDEGQDITLGALLGSVRFFDREGKVEPQFKDKNGNETTEWSEGAKVIEGSKLEKTIAMAKQLYVQDNLASREQPEDMQKALTEYVPQVLYAANVKSLVERNILEKPDQYKDRETINKNVAEFVKQVDNDNRPMEISDNTFINTKNSIVNQAYAYRGVLAKQLEVGADDNVDKTPVLNKVCSNVKPLDERPSSREIKTVTPNVWRNYASETLQGMGAAAIGTARVKGAQLVAVGLTHAATGIATAHLALAASAVVPVALTIKQISSWRKQQKAQNKPTGFKAFIKDKNMRWTLATTALTEAAVGCMFVPGAQPVGAALGMAALAIGVGRAGMNDYKKLREAGKGRIKAGSAAALGAVLKVGTAVLVNNAMTNFFNNHFGDKVEHKEASSREETHSEIKESAELQAGAKHTLDSFYKGNPEGLANDLAQVKEQLHAMGRDDISPEVFLRNACDAGMNTGTETVNHVDGGGIVHTHGNNLVLTDAWAQQHNVNVDEVHALGEIRGDDGNIKISPEALKGFDAVKYHISTINEVGSTVNADGSRLVGHQDGVLDRNAMVNDDGKTVHAPAGEGKEFNTYANGDNGYQQIKTTIRYTTPAHDVHTQINYNDQPMALGMLGIRNGGWIHKIAERVGALADRIVGKKVVKDKQTPPVVPTKPVKDKEPNKKTNKEPIVVRPQKCEDVMVGKYLKDEYQMLYGYKPTPDDKQYQAYCKRVEEELKAEPQGKDMKTFLEERRKLIDNVIEANVTETFLGTKAATQDLQHLQGYNQIPEKAKVIEDFKKKRTNSPITNAIRQDFWKSKNGNADEWCFKDFVKHADNYLKSTSENTKRDQTKAPLRRLEDGSRTSGR